MLRKPLLSHYSSGTTAFLCVDLQGVFSQRIANFRNCVFVANRFARLHEALPQTTKFIVTEQNQKRFGPTVPEIVLPSSATVSGKMLFSAMTDEVKGCLAGVQRVVVFGIEAHVCVLQTIEDLLHDNFAVYVALDGLGSQKEADKQAAVDIMRSWGPRCVVSTSESLMLQLVRSADDANFKKVATILKEQPPLPL